jgi:hypothetical protein
MVGNSPSCVATHTVAFVATMDTAVAKCGFGPHLRILRIMRGQFARKLTPVPECLSMTPEFYLVLRNRDADEKLADAVFEAGFDDSELTVRGDRAAIWICHRQGELTHLVREALAQASAGGLDVLHVEIENEVFA